MRLPQQVAWWLGAFAASILGAGLLSSTVFWACVLFFVAGWCGHRTGARWLVPVLAGLYVSHAQVIDALFPHRGSYLVGNVTAAGLCLAYILAGATTSSRVGGSSRRPQPLQIWFVVSVASLALLAALTLRSTSFGVHANYGSEYLAAWIGLCVAAGAVAVYPGFRFEPFAITIVVSGIGALFFVPGYWVAGYEISNAQRVSLAAVSAVVLFTMTGKHRWLLVAAPFIVATFLLGKEGPALAAVVGIGFAVAIHFGRPRWLSGTAVAALLGGAAAVLVWQWPSIADSIAARGMGSRVLLWHEAVDGWMRSPLVGQAEFGSLVYYPARDEWMYPHSATFEVLLSWGLLGFIPWLTAQVASVIGAARAMVLPMVVAALVMVHSSGDLVVNACYWIVGAAAIARASSALPKAKAATAATSAAEPAVDQRAWAVPATTPSTQMD